MFIKVWKLFKMCWRICIKIKKVDGFEIEVVILCIYFVSGCYDIYMFLVVDYIFYIILVLNDRYN